LRKRKPVDLATDHVTREPFFRDPATNRVPGKPGSRFTWWLQKQDQNPNSHGWETQDRIERDQEDWNRLSHESSSITKNGWLKV